MTDVTTQTTHTQADRAAALAQPLGDDNWRPVGGWDCEIWARPNGHTLAWARHGNGAVVAVDDGAGYRGLVLVHAWPLTSAQAARAWMGDVSLEDMARGAGGSDEAPDLHALMSFALAVDEDALGNTKEARLRAQYELAWNTTNRGG